MNEKSKINKGDILEYRAKRLLFHMGYYTQTNLIMKTSQQKPNDHITDLDVYGIMFTNDFSKITNWVDCKSGKTNVLNHIGWINGIKNLFNIDNVIFVKSNVRTNIKEYSNGLGIKIFDLDYLTILEKHYRIEEDDWSGGYDINFQPNLLKTFANCDTPNITMYKNLMNFMTSSYWELDSYSRVKKTITGLKQLSEVVNLPIDKNQRISIRWAIYNLTVLFLLATIEICGDLFYFSDSDKKKILEEGLVSGTIPIEKRQEISDISYKIAISTIKHYIPDFNEAVLPKADPSTPPYYFEAYYDLILRINKNPVEWSKSIRILEFTLMEYDLKERSIPSNLFKRYSSSPNDLEVCLKTIMHFVSQVGNVPKDLFSLLN